MQCHRAHEAVRDRVVIPLRIVVYAAHGLIIGRDDPAQSGGEVDLRMFADQPQARGKVRLVRPVRLGQAAVEQAVPDAADIRRIGNGLLDRSLPKADWTHEAHLAACLWLIREHPEIDLSTRLRGIISSYNQAVGGINDDTQGYHDTITHCFVRAVALHLSGCPGDIGLVDAVNGLLVSPYGRREWPLGFYSRDLLFSVTARRDFVSPDLVALPEIG